MICPNCGKEEHIQIISEYIELDKKEPAPVLNAMKNLAILGIIFSCVLFLLAFMTTSNCNTYEFSDIVIPGTLFLIAFLIFVKAISTFYRIKTILAFQPFLHQTNTKAVCLECGHTWYLEKDVK